MALDLNETVRLVNQGKIKINIVASDALVHAPGLHDGAIIHAVNDDLVDPLRLKSLAFVNEEVRGGGLWLFRDVDPRPHPNSSDGQKGESVGVGRDYKKSVCMVKRGEGQDLLLLKVPRDLGCGSCGCESPWKPDHDGLLPGISLHRSCVSRIEASSSVSPQHTR